MKLSYLLMGQDCTRNVLSSFAQYAPCQKRFLKRENVSNEGEFQYEEGTWELQQAKISVSLW